MTRWKLILEWHGAPFLGWQRQDHGPTVQAAVERAARAMTGEEATVLAAGRTDAGVHALGMAVHVDLKKQVTPYRLQEGLNALLRPDPVAVLSAEPVADNWHARFSCVGRRYLYRITNRRAPLTLDRQRAWRIGPVLDMAAMQHGAAMLVGRHDFTTFRSVHCQSADPVKTLDRLEVVEVGSEVHIHAEARSFLHHQVRSMVGCLALVGQGQWQAEQIRQALEARNRAALGLNAPPEGLYFVEAIYPETPPRSF